MQMDWARPWFAPWRATGEAVAADVEQGLLLHDALNRQPVPVRFVDQAQLPEGRPYESFVFETGCCPVRPGLHDFFNGLCWLRFPQAKRTLNRLQAQAIARDGVGARRGPVRDAITLFDESGALLQAAPPLWQALRARAWRRLFVELRPLWREARLLVFGHALLEQLAAPRKNITAHVWCEPCPAGEGPDLDAWLAAQLAPGRLAAKPFTPLPVLGVPGWCAENENFSFYDDSLVFRPPRASEPSTTTTLPGPRRS
ncbi:DUF3025 domain-containing protein [Ramlibacter sp.]|uniref:DUF3025 domain-containing protein n=1 Tax=Ramlibacter sp. TaxID=1917967 RepID=UPI0017F06567|nr:DUF3025 domain-containing protein [Ramlibacter sp.]MBA2674429.1 DUF3025 domain-containing protein [Ramlibacter sp.]